MERITVPASLDELDTVQDFISENLENYQCPAKAMMAIEIAVEEIFVNIASYAYRPEIGVKDYHIIAFSLCLQLRKQFKYICALEMHSFLQPV